MRRPNFFIVGHGRSGSTSLHTYLRSHPQIFMPLHKEPNYFSQDLQLTGQVHDERTYLELFAPATSRHLVIGEASPHYIFSQVAIPKIFEFAPNAKLIALLRDPVSRLCSHHARALAARTEDVADFEVAWGLQKERLAGRRLPPCCPVPLFLQYREWGYTGAPVARMLEVFPREQIKFVVFDDLKRDPRGTYLELLDFLGVPDDGRQEFPRAAANKEVRSAWFQRRFFVKPPRPLRLAREVLRKALPPERYVQLYEFVADLNARPATRRPIRPEFRKHLLETFRADIDLLSELIGRDLSSWYQE